MEQNGTPGKGKAIGGLICGIIALVFCWLGFLGATGLIPIVAGIVGLILSGSAKKDGATGGMVTAGFVLALIGLIIAAIWTIVCVACYGCASSIA